MIKNTIRNELIISKIIIFCFYVRQRKYLIYTTEIRKFALIKKIFSTYETITCMRKFLGFIFLIYSQFLLL